MIKDFKKWSTKFTSKRKNVMCLQDGVKHPSEVLSGKRHVFLHTKMADKVVHACACDRAKTHFLWTSMDWAPY